MGCGEACRATACREQVKSVATTVAVCCRSGCTLHPSIRGGFGTCAPFPPCAPGLAVFAREVRDHGRQESLRDGGPPIWIRVRSDGSPPRVKSVASSGPAQWLCVAGADVHCALPFEEV